MKKVRSYLWGAIKVAKVRWLDLNDGCIPGARVDIYVNDVKEKCSIQSSVWSFSHRTGNTYRVCWADTEICSNAS